MMQLSCPNNDTLCLKGYSDNRNIIHNEALRGDASVVINLDSCPYNDGVFPKDNSAIKDTADNKDFSNDVIWDISQGSFPYNEIDSPKRPKYGYTKF